MLIFSINTKLKTEQKMNCKWLNKEATGMERTVFSRRFKNFFWRALIATTNDHKERNL